MKRSNVLDVSLERFSLWKAPSQGNRVKNLVEQNKDWLLGTYPGTVDRYRDYPHAVKNVARIAVNSQMDGYIVRHKNGHEIGLATTISGQTLVHPEKGEVTGTDLDYWLDPFLDDESLHLQTAVELVRVIDTENSIATIHPLRKFEPVGLGYIMTEVGNPAALATPTGEDPFGVTKDGTVVQLYSRDAYSEFPVS